jgi:small subunit ribosomal protein S7e
MTETKKTHDIFEKTKGVKGANLSHLESTVGGAVIEAVNHLDAETKKLGSILIINKVQEISFEKDKSAVIIYFTYRTSKILLTPAFKKLVTELEKRLKKTVLLLSAKRIQSRWVKENRKLTRPNSRTLSAVYATILDELLLPAIIIGSRTRVRLDGSSFSKIVLDKSEQHFMEDRVSAIKAVYRKLTNRDIEIEFQKEATYYNLKKGEKR